MADLPKSANFCHRVLTWSGRPAYRARKPRSNRKRGQVLGGNAASHLQRRKLTTFRPGRLWLFTHSTARRRHRKSGWWPAPLPARMVSSAQKKPRFNRKRAIGAGQIIEPVAGFGKPCGLVPPPAVQSRHAII